MKGLVLRGLLLLRVYIPAAIAAAAAALAASLALRSDIPLFALLITAGTLLPQALAARDGSSGWNALCCALPVRRRDAVAARYFLSLLVVAVLFAAAPGLTALRRWLRPAAVTTVDDWIIPLALLLCVFTLSLVLPVIEGRGTKGGAILSALLLVFPCGGAGVLLALLSGEGELSLELVGRLTDAALGLDALLFALLPAGSVAVMLSASFLLSVSIREKREF